MVALDPDVLTECRERVRDVRPGRFRRANQMQVAETYGVPYWLAGVQGFRTPLLARWRAYVARRGPAPVLVTLDPETGARHAEEPQVPALRPPSRRDWSAPH